jgi:hypothetical protein
LNHRFAGEEGSLKQQAKLQCRRPRHGRSRSATPEIGQRHVGVEHDHAGIFDGCQALGQSREEDAGDGKDAPDDGPARRVV